MERRCRQSPAEIDYEAFRVPGLLIPPVNYLLSLKVKAKKNPKLLLGLLLVAHMAAISLNRIPSLSGQPTGASRRSG
jgi:hypothetical protein